MIGRHFIVKMWKTFLNTIQKTSPEVPIPRNRQKTEIVLITYQ